RTYFETSPHWRMVFARKEFRAVGARFIASVPCYGRDESRPYDGVAKAPDSRFGVNDEGKECRSHRTCCNALSVARPRPGICVSALLSACRGDGVAIPGDARNTDRSRASGTA